MSGDNHRILDEGDTFLFDVTFTNTSTGVLTAPSTVTYAERAPSQDEDSNYTTTSGWTNPSTGRYTRTVTVDEPGLWQLEARGAGNSVDQRHVVTIDVRRSNLRV